MALAASKSTVHSEPTGTRMPLAEARSSSPNEIGDSAMSGAIGPPVTVTGSRPPTKTRTTNRSGRHRATDPRATSVGGSGKTGSTAGAWSALVGRVARATQPARRPVTVSTRSLQAAGSSPAQRALQ